MNDQRVAVVTIRHAKRYLTNDFTPTRLNVTFEEQRNADIGIISAGATLIMFLEIHLKPAATQLSQPLQPQPHTPATQPKPKP